MFRLMFVCSAVVVACFFGPANAQPAPTPATPAPPPMVDAADVADPFLWLEDVHGARALDWVRAENAKTLGVLQHDSRFARLNADALGIVQAKDRIANPEFIAGDVYNFWQDAEHVRGIWRRTTLADYRRAAPAWTTVLDLDALAKIEGANWVWEGALCREPEERRCLLSLSDGGEDAVAVREFDLRTGTFVAGGFALGRGKQRVAWEDDDTLLVAREWAPGELTTSGYPYVVKRLRRGQSPAQAVEVFRGSPTDGGYGASPLELHDGAGNHAAVIVRPLTTFTAENYLVTPSGTRKLNIPGKARVEALVAGRLILKLDETWSTADVSLPAGSVAWVDFAAAVAHPEQLRPRPVVAPGNRESVEGLAATKSRLLVTAYDNVRGRAFVYTPTRNGWDKQRLDLPDNSTISVVDTSLRNDDAFVSVASFLTPPTLWFGDIGSHALAVVKSSPARFDAASDTVEQHEATSRDGTRVPYFIVHPKTLRLDGGNPTILYAYGGFDVSLTPAYSALTGKLWLERGGVYVLANIRGGGEFGPAWHDAGLTTHRQRIYDDFAAVANDLIARKITSPRRLGIQGGSNGGLLMGVEFTQHPELWRAVDIQVPLLDMLRFEKIAAGTSWVGEYGSVSNPEQRAFLASISPYNNLRAGVSYPEPFIWTTTKDDRVGPQHARKFAARLAALGDPYLFYEVIEGGHGAGANLQERAFTTTLEMTYFIRKLMDDGGRGER